MIEPTTKPARAASKRPNRAYSRILAGGAGGTANGNTREGRFVKAMERELLAQIGGEPTFTQRLLIRRVTKMMALAERLDEKLTTGDTWTPHDARTFGGLNNAIRVALRDLGLKPVGKPKAPSPLAAHFAKAGG